MKTESTYVPGMCNINTAEVAYRRKAMWFGVGASVILLIGLLVIGAHWGIRIIALFVPVFVAAVGYLQVKNRFCVSYGASGQQNASEGSDAAAKVNQENAKIDKQKARKMNLQALAITALVLLVASILPTLQ